MEVSYRAMDDGVWSNFSAADGFFAAGSREFIGRRVFCAFVFFSVCIL